MRYISLKAFLYPSERERADYPRVDIIDSYIHHDELVKWCMDVSGCFEADACCPFFDIWIPVNNSKSNTFISYFSDLYDFFD